MGPGVSFLGPPMNFENRLFRVRARLTFLLSPSARTRWSALALFFPPSDRCLSSTLDFHNFASRLRAVPSCAFGAGSGRVPCAVLFVHSVARLKKLVFFGIARLVYAKPSLLKVRGLSRRNPEASLVRFGAFLGSRWGRGPRRWRCVILRLAYARGSFMTSRAFVRQRAFWSLWILPLFCFPGRARGAKPTFFENYCFAYAKPILSGLRVVPGGAPGGFPAIPGLA